MSLIIMGLIGTLIGGLLVRSEPVKIILDILCTTVHRLGTVAVLVAKACIVIAAIVTILQCI